MYTFPPLSSFDFTVSTRCLNEKQSSLFSVVKMLAWTMYECSYYKVRLETVLMISCYIIIFTYTLSCVYLRIIGRCLCILYYFMVYCSTSWFWLALHILCPVLICNIINMFYCHHIRLHIVIWYEVFISGYTNYIIIMYYST